MLRRRNVRSDVRTLPVSVQRAIERASGQRPGPARSKYRNEPVAWRGWRFDSKAERDYAMYLESLYRAGDVLAWLHHPVFPLSDGVGPDAVRIELDFFVVLPNGSFHVVDVKGAVSDGFKVKARLFRVRYPHLLLVVAKRAGKTGWDQGPWED